MVIKQSSRVNSLVLFWLDMFCVTSGVMVQTQTQTAQILLLKLTKRIEEYNGRHYLVQMCLHIRQLLFDNFYNFFMRDKATAT